MTKLDWNPHKTYFLTSSLGCLGLAAISCASASALSATAGFSVIVPKIDALEVSLSASHLVLNLTPKAAEPVFGSTDLTVTVGTSGVAGYTLTMNANDTNLTSATGETISTLTEDENGYTCTAAACNFTVNRWGFKKSTDIAYNYVPLSAEITSSAAPINGDVTTINFASRVDASQPAGSYSTTLNFVVTVNPLPMTIDDISTLQDFATLSTSERTGVINSMVKNQSYTLSDTRDNEEYTIAKLADGNVWFLDNLRLNPAAATLTADNTNVTAPVTTTFINKTSSWYGNEGFTNAWYNLRAVNKLRSYGSGSNKVGGYYNYCAASAGTYCMDSESGSGDATQDLCPAGWRMPTGGENGEYAGLAYAVTGTSGNLTGDDRTDFMEAFHAGPYGTFWVGSEIEPNTGFFWSSTNNDSTLMMHDLLINSTTVSVANSTARNYAYVIRCILKN